MNTFNDVTSLDKEIQIFTNQEALYPSQLYYTCTFSTQPIPLPPQKKTKNMFYKNLKFSWVNILLGKKIEIIGSISTCLVIITVNPSET